MENGLLRGLDVLSYGESLMTKHRVGFIQSSKRSKRQSSIDHSKTLLSLLRIGIGGGGTWTIIKPFRDHLQTIRTLDIMDTILSMV